MGAGGGSQGFGDFMAGGFRNDVFGTNREAEAAQNAASQQQALVQSQQAQALGYAKDYNQDLTDLAKASPQELQAYGQSLEASGKQLAQSQRLIDAIDPALMEASKQVLSLMRGETSGVGNAIGNQRAQQRQGLVNSLRNQYGPSGETSSAGMKALQSFDSESASLGAQNQNQSIATLMGVMSGRPDINNALQGINQAGANFGNIQTRMLGARQQGGQTYLSTLMGTNAPVLQSAGANQTADLIKAGAQRSFFDNWSNSSMRFGEMAGGAGMSAAAGGGKKASGGGAVKMDMSGLNTSTPSASYFQQENPFSASNYKSPAM